MRGRGTLFLVALALGLAACSGGDSGTAGEAIAGFGKAPNEGLGLSKINQVALREPDDTRSAALESIDSDDPDVRFASAYALALTGIEEGDADALRPLLEAEDTRLRLLAAQTLAAAGVGEGVPVLISLLGSDDPLRDGLRVWQVARRTLLDLTGQDLGLVEATDLAAASATIPDWDAWWASAEGSFTPAKPSPVFG